MLHANLVTLPGRMLQPLPIKTMTPMPTVRKLAASGVTGDRLYVVGGWNYEVGGSINTLEIFKP